MNNADLKRLKEGRVKHNFEIRQQQLKWFSGLQNAIYIHMTSFIHCNKCPCIRHSLAQRMKRASKDVFELKVKIVNCQYQMKYFQILNLTFYYDHTSCKCLNR